MISWFDTLNYWKIAAINDIFSASDKKLRMIPGINYC